MGSADLAFNHVPHPLLHARVRDTQTLCEGTLMAVLREPLGFVGGRERYGLTAYIRGADGREFTTAVSKITAA